MTDFALILAAGSSSRLGEPKQLVELAGETLVQRAVRVAREAGLEPVVVVGSEADLVAEELDARTVFNAHWSHGMGTSIATGVKEVGAEARTLTVMTCDQLRVGADDLRALLGAVAGHDVAAARYDGVVGVPATFTPACYSALAELTGDEGARKLLRTKKFAMVAVHMPTAKYDVDTPTDLEAIP